MPKKFTKEQFVEKANLVHGNKFDYSKVEYINMLTKVCIICPVHGDFFQKPSQHCGGDGCMRCYRERQNKCLLLTTEEFIKRAKKVHGNKYDYSNVEYIKSDIKVSIICHKHGEFLQTPSCHWWSKHGCQLCKKDKQKNKILNFGINDYDGLVKINGRHIKSYKTWSNLIVRCYNEKTHEKYPAYTDCTVCEGWKYFSNFKKWFDDNYVDEYALDKDILIKGNKVYSPETCCFVPVRINALFGTNKKRRGKYPIGVFFRKDKGKYCAVLNKTINKKHKINVLGYFKTETEAFFVYKEAKEKYIKEVAQDYYDKGLIKQNVYEALMKYEIEIID